MGSDDDVAAFIRSSFRSVWSLEVLLLLKRSPRAWTEAEIVETMRASQLIVAQSLAGLTAAGLISVDETGSARYRPASAAIEQAVDQAEARYARAPDAVRRLIVGAAGAGLTAFADAFRLRKD